MTRPDGDWMSTTEACRYLGITLRTLYRRIEAGEIEASQPTRQIFVSRPSVDAFLEQTRIQPGELGHLTGGEQ